MNPHFIACEFLADIREALGMISKPEGNTSYILLIDQTDLFKSKQDMYGRTTQIKPSTLIS